MEEKQEKKEEFKGKMGIVWLTGILVIILGCVTVYTIKLANDNKKLNQAPAPAQQPQTVATQEQAKPQTTAKEEKTEETKTTSTQEKTTYTFDNLEGIYIYKEKINRDGETVYNSHELTLYSDGTYSYSDGVDVAHGSVGNYIINGNKIVLNSWFETFSDVSINLKNEKTTYTINNDKSIDKMNKTNDKISSFNVLYHIKQAIDDKAVSAE